MPIRPALAVLLHVAFAAPAAAASYPNCVGAGSPGVSIEFGFSVGGKTSKEDQEFFDKARLRAAGIRADTVERTWLDCFKVTRIENGRYVTEFYHPDNLEAGPLQLERN